MGTANASTFLRRLTRGMAAETLRDQSDRQLVERLLAGRDEAVFEAIVRRHGPMVYRVCWRVCQQEQDTEDAFQATFLILAQRLHTVRRHASLASWLHGIAHRVALKARAQAATRRRREQKAATDKFPPDEVTWRELRAVLDAELQRLPEKWRSPLVLCCLQGRTQDEAAKQVGWSRRTLRRRLEEARAALGRRLTRRGVVWPTALSAVLLSDCAAPAALAPGLVGSTVEAAAQVAAGRAVTTAVVSAKVAALTEGVVKTMFMSKLKVIAAAIVLVGALTSGAWLLVADGLAAEPQESKADSKEPSRPEGRAKVKVLSVDGFVQCLAWSRNGKLLATASFIQEKDGDTVLETTTVRIWDAQKGEVKIPFAAEQKTRVHSVAFSPDGRLLAIAVTKPAMVNADEVRLVDVEKGDVKHTIPFSGNLGGLAFSPDGKRLAFGGRMLDIMNVEGNKILINLWDVTKGEVVTKIERPLHENGVFMDGSLGGLAFSPVDGKLLAAGETGHKTDHKLRLWDTETGKLSQTLDTDGIGPFAFSPDGQALVSGSAKTVKTWDIEKGKERMTLDGNKGHVTCVAFAPNGKMIATSGVFKDEKDSVRGEAILWDANSGKMQQAFPDQIGPVLGIAFSPDGRTLAIATGQSKDGKLTGEVRLWQVK